MSYILYNCEDGKAVELHSSPNNANNHCVDFYTTWYVHTLLKNVQIFHKGVLLFGVLTSMLGSPCRREVDSPTWGPENAPI
eukprot:CCRYP_011856-RA/>CCRYP_011856-RA protein AED:0.00 eAED:0.00 QI:4/1/1/1/0/0/2/180/80